jgi:hypothetical protein
MQQWGGLVADSDDVIEDVFERPGSGETRESFDDHGQQNDDQSAAIRPDQA